MLDKEIKDYLEDCGRVNSISNGEPEESVQRCILLDYIGETITCTNNGWGVDDFTDSDWTEACNAYLDGLAEDYGCYYKYNPWKDKFELRIDMEKEGLKKYAKIMADNVMDGETASIQFEGAVWDAYNSEDDENTVVFACDGNVYEYEYHSKEELDSIIYDFFEELI